eukprot:TRINITY_DN22846_c0_g1_i1.p2 TRINITY_DN22846_c0_g1~~TRINITY_DN22846_c0_g1_i1.p2  ORF type:complete len:295 (-),score=121.72 TRINITY_DN22846_c0_g1_i1:442-1326(-)
MTDPVTLVALAVAVVFVLGVVYFLGKQKKEAPRGAYISEFELSLSSKKDKKKDKKKPAPKTEKSPAIPIVARRLKGVDGAADHDTDEQMLNFLNQKITLETKKKDTKDARNDSDEEVPKPRKEKAPKQPAEAVEKGYTAVVDRKKPAKEKEADEAAAKPEDAEPAKKRPAKAFYKADEEAAKREAEARRAEREKERKERSERPRPPRENGGANLPPRLRREGGAEAPAEGAEGAEGARRPRGEGAPRVARPPVVPQHTEPFEEWSLDSMLDSITNSAPESKKKKAAEAAAVEQQ